MKSGFVIQHANVPGWYAHERGLGRFVWLPFWKGAAVFNPQQVEDFKKTTNEKVEVVPVSEILN